MKTGRNADPRPVWEIYHEIGDRCVEKVLLRVKICEEMSVRCSGWDLFLVEQAAHFVGERAQQERFLQDGSFPVDIRTGQGWVIGIAGHE
jgi:hypothetical protein